MRKCFQLELVSEIGSFENSLCLQKKGHYIIIMKRACGPAFVEFGQIDIHSSVDLGWKPPTTQPLCLLTILEVGVFPDDRYS